MSLTQEIKNNKRFRDAVVSTIKPGALKEINASIKYYPTIIDGVSTKYGAIGTAFDYQVRIELNRQYRFFPNQEAVEDLIVSRVVNNFNSSEMPHLLDCYNSSYRDLFSTNPELQSKALLNITKIEQFYRSGKFSLLQDLRKVNAKSELARLFKIFDEEIRREYFIQADIQEVTRFLESSHFFAEAMGSRRHINFNTTFSQSYKFGGADADLIVDQTIVDFKTNKKIVITQEMAVQLLVYYVLAMADGIIIDTISVYFARYLQFVDIDVREFCDVERLCGVLFVEYGVG